MRFSYTPAVVLFAAGGPILVSVLVPTLNERANIGELIERTLSAFGRLDVPAELVVVDDASPDGTAQAARETAGVLGAGDRVTVMERRTAPGLAQAVVAGIAAARGDLLIVMDADLSHPPELIPDLVRAVSAQGVSCAVASRYVAGGGSEGWPWFRRWLSRGACWLTRPLLKIKDATSGFFAFRRDCVQGVSLVPRGYKIGLEILVRGRVERAVEVPFVFRDRAKGTSKLGRKVVAAYLRQLADLYSHRFPGILRYLQFCLVGLGGMAVDWVAFQALYRGAGLALRFGQVAGGGVAQVGSFGAAVAFNYFLNRAWTFRDRAEGGRLLSFVAVCTGGLAIRSAVFLAVVRGGGAPALPAEQAGLLMGIVAASLWNFWASARWVFPTAKHVGTSPWRRTDRWAAGLVVALTVVRLAFAAVTPLAGDEAYYWQWSRHLAWGYFDHPPLVAYLIAAGTRVLGPHPLGVRLGAVALSAAGSWWLYVLGREVWGSGRAGLWTLVAAAVTPLFAAGALILTPDTPLVALWTAAVLLALRAVRSGRTRDWVLLGGALGLGLMSKLPMLVLFPALGLAFACTARGRRALRSPGPYGAVAVAGLVWLPYLVWHVRSGFAPLLFQLRHGLGPAAGAAKAATGVRTFAQFVGGQIGVVTPLLFGFVLWGIVAGVLRLAQSRRADAPADPDALAISVLATVVPLTVFAAASWLTRSEPNWTAPAYPTAFVLAAGPLGRCFRRGGWPRGIALGALALAAAVTVFAQAELTWPRVAFAGGPVRKVHDRSDAVACAARLGVGVDPTEPVMADGYTLASVLAFGLPDHPETGAPFETGSGSAYREWQTPRGKSGWYVTRRRSLDGVRELFRDFELVGTCDDVRRGVRLDTWRVYRGTLTRGSS